MCADLYDYFKFSCFYEKSRRIPLKGAESYGIIGKKLGEGTFGKVSALKSKSSTFAIKIDKNINGTNSPSTAFYTEASILMRIKHPSIIKIIDIIPPQSDMGWSLVMERKRGDIIDYFDGKFTINSPFVPERVSYQLLSALAYINDRGIIHRDIRPENILLDNEGNATLCDFGWAVEMIGQQLFDPGAQTLDYRAPELLMLMGSYDTAVDIWSAGCTIWELFNRKLLFSGIDENDMLARFVSILGIPQFDDFPQIIMRDKIIDCSRGSDGPVYRQKGISHLTEGLGSCGPLIRSMLVYNPQKRPKASELILNKIFDRFRTPNQITNSRARERYPLDGIPYQVNINRKMVKSAKYNIFDLYCDLELNPCVFFKTMALFDQVLNTVILEEKELIPVAMLCLEITDATLNAFPLSSSYIRAQFCSLSKEEWQECETKVMTKIKFNLSFSTIYQCLINDKGHDINTTRGKIILTLMVLGSFTTLPFHYGPEELYLKYCKLAHFDDNTSFSDLISKLKKVNRNKVNNGLKLFLEPNAKGMSLDELWLYLDNY